MEVLYIISFQLHIQIPLKFTLIFKQQDRQIKLDIIPEWVTTPI
jgi:hypothetical protein